MSHKFFAKTWTKGDRRNAAEALRSGGDTSAVDECIAIQGLDGFKNEKVHNHYPTIWANLTLMKGKPRRKPLPLDLGRSPGSPSRHSSRTSDSIALQSAAVQSATSLLAVMNEVLRSPHIASHLSAHYGAPPSHGRPRSHTAPSTPLAEAPFIEPVELPGSLMAGKESTASVRRSFDGNNEPRASLRANAHIGPTLVRPHTSPHESTFHFMRHEAPSSGILIPTSSLAPPAQSLPRPRSASPGRSSTRAETTLVPHSCEDTLVATDHDTSTIGLQRPSLSILQSWPVKPANSPSMAASRTTSTQSNAQGRSTAADSSGPRSCSTSATDHDSGLIQQIALMRARHEAHLSSLKEAHEREIESQLSYISLLEKHLSNPLAAPATLQRQLTLDTSRGAPQVIEPPSADASATTIQSSEVSFTNQKRSSEGALAETEALKRKLSLCHKAVAEAGDVRRERDHLREVTDRNERRILQLKDIVRKSKDQEKTLKNAVADLEARLVAANNERIDVLEGFHEACEQVKVSAKREAAMHTLTAELHARLFYNAGRHAFDTALALPNNNPSKRPRHGRAASDVGSFTGGRDSDLGQFVELRRLINEKDAKIKTLELQVAQSPSGTIQANNHSVNCGNRLKELQERLAKAEADCERYNALLHSELRRQSKSASQNTPYLNKEAAAEANAKLQTVKSQSDATGAPIEFLERELQHCLTEIILYKLDIKGYKKDLKRAKAQIESLQTIGVKAPPTPDRDSTSSVKGNKSSQRHRAKSSSTGNPDITSGLGINLSSSTTPTQETGSAPTSALLTTTSNVPSTISSPSARPKADLSSRKKLPPPPPQTPSPLLSTQATPPPTSSVARLHRGETLRSISDSIISSYAKRTPEQKGAAQSPVTAGQPPTPSRSAGTTPVFEPLRSHPVVEAVQLSA